VSLPQGDLAAYFDRIGWSGDPRSDRVSLAAIVERHAASIPFESVDPFLGRSVSLEREAIVTKLVRQRRGGYCFEHNGLLAEVLTSVGFEVTPLAARVLWMQPEDAMTPRTHMLLLVNLPEGPVLADVGFGGAVCTGVLDLAPDAVQETPHERFRLIQRGREWHQQVEIGGEWRTTYRFDLTPQLPVDYELANWWTSANPSSHFTFTLIAALSPPGRRLALRNFDYAVHAGGSTDRRRLESADQVCDVLEQDFGIGIDDREQLRSRLESVAA